MDRNKLNTIFKQKKYTIIAVVLYILTCAILFYAQFKLYKGIVNFMAVYCVIFPPIVLIGTIFKENEVRKENKLLSNIVVVVCLFLAIFVLKNDKYYFAAYYVLFLCIIFGVSEFLIKNKNDFSYIYTAKSVCWIFGCAIFTFLFFVTAVCPVNVVTAKNKLIKHGYSEINFLYSVSDDIVINITSEKLGNDIQKPGFYVFKAKNNDKYYGIIFEVSNSEYSVVESDKNDDLKFWRSY